MEHFFSLVAGLISGILSSMGMGGGGPLIIYLTVFCGLDQVKAQGINLLFFIPTSIVAISLYAKKRLIIWDIVFLMSAFGLIGTVIGTLILPHIDTNVLRKLFGGLLFIMAIKQFRS